MDDGHLHTPMVDAFGNEFFFDPAPAFVSELDPYDGSEPLPDEFAGSSPEALIAATAAVPAYSSNPSSTRKLFLDFDGHIVTGTNWNSFNNNNPIHAQPYSTDSDVFNFSNSELNNIYKIWQRVAEDFAPFDVDVTTVEPGILTQGNPSRRALRVMISTDKDSAAMGGTGNQWYSNAGGVAYLNSWQWSSDTPVWVFENRLGNGSEKSVGEASSHEIGHAFGLRHDGIGSSEYYSGHGSGWNGWAPIMGVGYSRWTTQWSKGEYNNATNTEDDLARITRSANQVNYRTDDHGDTIATSTQVAVDSNHQFSTSGIIERNTDKDSFTFASGAGEITINAYKFERGPNLNIYLELFDASGTSLGTANPYSNPNASLTVTLPSTGQYTVKVEGRGQDNANNGFTSYGSLGQYTLDATLQPAITLDTDLVAYYSFDNGNANDEAPDDAIDDHGSLSGPASIQGSGGYDGQGYFATNNGGIITLPHTTETTDRIVDQRTISGWFYVNNPDISNRKQVVFEYGGLSRGLNGYVHDGKFYVGTWNSISTESDFEGSWISTQAVQANTWHHFTLELDGDDTTDPGAMTLRFDGQVVGHAAASQVWTHGNGSALGGVSDVTFFHDGEMGTSADVLNGRVDEFRVYNRLLSPQELSDLAPSPGSTDLTSGLVAHYTFEGNTNDVAPLDSVNDQGTLTSGTVIQPDNSFDGGGNLHINNTAERMIIPFSPEVDGSSIKQRTISGWFYMWDTNVGNRKQVIFEEGGGTRGLNVYVQSGRLYAGGWNTPTTESGWEGNWVTANSIASQTWHHFTLVLDGTENIANNALTLYVNGNEVGSTAGSQVWGHNGGTALGNVDRKTLFHDGQLGSTGQYMIGRIDDFRIYNRALSESAISELASVFSPSTPAGSAAVPESSASIAEASMPMAFMPQTTIATPAAWSLVEDDSENDLVS